MKNHIRKFNQGQSIVILTVFMGIFISVTTAAIIIISTNSVAADAFQQGISARQVAESGIENAILRLLRNPDYLGESLLIGNGSATVSVAGDTTKKTIISIGTLGNFQRKIEAKIGYTNDYRLIVTSWKEIP